jgi:hypothetical protein
MLLVVRVLLMYHLPQGGRVVNRLYLNSGLGELSTSAGFGGGCLDGVPCPHYGLVVDLVELHSSKKGARGCRPALYACTCVKDENSSQCRRMS